MSIVRDITDKTARETFELVEDYYSGTMIKPLKKVFENYLIEIENKLDLKYEITDDTSTLKGGVGEDPLHGFGSFGWGNLLESPDANVANSYIWTARNTITNESYLQMGVYRKDGTSESILDFDVNGGNIPFARLGLKEAGSFTQAIQFTTSGTYLAGTVGGATDAGNNIEDAASDSKVLIVNGDYVKSTNMSQFRNIASRVKIISNQTDLDNAIANLDRFLLIDTTSTLDMSAAVSQGRFYIFNTDDSFIALTTSNTSDRVKISLIGIDRVALYGSGDGFDIRGSAVGEVENRLDAGTEGVAIIGCHIGVLEVFNSNKLFVNESSIGVLNLRNSPQITTLSLDETVINRFFSDEPLTSTGQSLVNVQIHSGGSNLNYGGISLVDKAIFVNGSWRADQAPSGQVLEITRTTL